jgi:hypothetical protein
VGISIDSPEQNAAMIDKLGLPFPLLSDPDRSGAIEPYGLADATDPRNVARPAVVIVGTDGEEKFRQPSRDFADRPPDDDILDNLRSLGLPVADQEAPALGPTQPGPYAMPLEQMLPYFRGGRFAVVALSRRHPETKHEADRYVEQLDGYVEAVKQAFRAKRAQQGS